MLIAAFSLMFFPPWPNTTTNSTSQSKLRQPSGMRTVPPGPINVVDGGFMKKNGGAPGTFCARCPAFISSR